MGATEWGPKDAKAGVGGNGVYYEIRMCTVYVKCALLHIRGDTHDFREEKQVLRVDGGGGVLENTLIQCKYKSDFFTECMFFSLRT